MNNIIDFHEYKRKREISLLSSGFYDLFYTLFNLFVEYVMYPVVAAVQTIRKRKIVII